MNRLEPEMTDLPAGGATSVRGDMPIIAIDMPVMYEDEGQEEMGETTPHNDSSDILHYGIRAHLADRPELDVRADLNVYYHLIDRWSYVSPDLAVFRPSTPLGRRLRSYRIGTHGPAPIFVAEVLSQRSFQQQDLSNKPVIYAQLGVAEYLLVDVTGEYLPQRLLLKRWQPDETWIDCQDPDGGVTSTLGFRVILESDEQIRIANAATGHRYLRPNEAEERVRALEEELARLRGQQSDRNA